MDETLGSVVVERTDCLDLLVMIPDVLRDSRRLVRRCSLHVVECGLSTLRRLDSLSHLTDVIELSLLQLRRLLQLITRDEAAIDLLAIPHCPRLVTGAETLRGLDWLIATGISAI